MDVVKEVVDSFTKSGHECWCVRYAILTIGILGTVALAKMALTLVV